ncbi:MAG TPA: four helix bundle protein [Tepidisphaeraceae bacterium]
MTETQMLDRTKQFSLRVMKLAAALPNHRQWWPIAAQIIPSGTSVGANYRAACRGRSKAEFLAKLGIVEEETDETMFWMEMIMEGGGLEADRVKPLYQEADELLRIIVASRRTTSETIANRKSQIANPS